jgi:hypothetical protein
MRLLSPILSLDIEPTVEAIKKALSDIQNVKRDPYVILEKNERNYLQTFYSNEGYVLEYQSGPLQEHFRSIKRLNQDTISKVFDRYFQDDLQWKSGIEFKKTTMPKPISFRVGYFVGTVVSKIQKYLNRK